jgi:hypothetical protein
MKPVKRDQRRHVLWGGAAALAAGLWAAAAPAQDATWLLSPGSGDFNTAANWSTNTVPTGTASFGASNTTNLSFSTSTTVGALQFNALAPFYVYTLAGAGSFVVTIGGAGIVNNSSNAPAINVPDVGKRLNFTNASTAVHQCEHGGQYLH